MRRAALVVCSCLAAAVHGAAWLGLAQAPSGGRTSRAPAPLHVVFAHPSDRPTTGQTATAQPVAPEPTAQAPVIQQRSPDHAAADASVPAGQPQPVAPADADDTHQRSGDHGAISNDDGLYLPRRSLTRPPRPLAEVQIDYPPGTPAGEFSAVLLLYIDEAGQVRRITLRSGELTPGLEAAARSAFYAVRFTPGELAGRAVRSIYPVEVSFIAQQPVRDASPR